MGGADGDRTYRLGRATLLTTMLSVTNTTAAADLNHFDPDPRCSAPLQAARRGPAGAGQHLRARDPRVPAARFSISAIRTAVRRLVDTYDLEPCSPPPLVRRRQIGGVARAEQPLRIRYRART